MKKKILLIVILVIVIIIAGYFFVHRTVKLSDNKYFKEIYKCDNVKFEFYETKSVDGIITNGRSGTYLQEDKLKQVLDNIKDVKIKRAQFFEKDKINVGYGIKGIMIYNNMYNIIGQLDEYKM